VGASQAVCLIKFATETFCILTLSTATVVICLLALARAPEILVVLADTALGTSCGMTSAPLLSVITLERVVVAAGARRERARRERSRQLVAAAALLLGVVELAAAVTVISAASRVLVALVASAVRVAVSAAAAAPWRIGTKAAGDGARVKQGFCGLARWLRGAAGRSSVGGSYPGFFEQRCLHSDPGAQQHGVGCTGTLGQCMRFGEPLCVRDEGED
jgi:hypothetical protein